MIDFHDQNYGLAVLKSDIPVLIDVWAKWCPTCPQMFPIVEEVERHFAGKISAGKVDADGNGMFVSAYGIMSLPTLLLFVKGDVVWMTTGKTDKDTLIREISKHI